MPKSKIIRKKQPKDGLFQCPKCNFYCIDSGWFWHCERCKCLFPKLESSVSRALSESENPPSCDTCARFTKVNAQIDPRLGNAFGHCEKIGFISKKPKRCSLWKMK